MNKSIEELEAEYWTEPSDDSSSLILKCHLLRKKAIADFSIEDCRLMIGQRIGLKYLVPTALAYLKENPFAEGDFYEGDLLVNVLRIDRNFWIENAQFIPDLNGIILSVKSRIHDLDTTDEIRDAILNSIQEYR
jgi:hypothetical protein